MVEDNRSPESILRELNRLQMEIEDAKSRRERELGRKQEIMSRLQRAFGIKTVDEAKKRILALDAQITRRNKAIAKAYKDLVERYELY